MMNEKYIPFPTEEEKNDSIQKIVTDGVQPPCSLGSAVMRLIREISVRELFFGVGDCVFLAFLAAALLWSAVFASAGQTEAILPMLMFFASPFLYALLHLLTVWKEIMAGTYERLMTCRLSLRQMTILRMLVFGGISVLASTLLNAGLWFILSDECKGAYTYLRMTGISFSGLFLFAWMELMAEWKWRLPASCTVAPLLWGVLGILSFLWQEHIRTVLFAVPTAVFVMIACTFAVLYFGTLKRYYFDSKEGALSHAFS